MTTTENTFWDDVDDSDPGFVRPLDRWGRSSIIPAGQGPEKAVYYTRASTLANTLSDKSGLTIWQQRAVVRGMGRRPDLVDLAASVGDECREDRARNALYNAALDECAAQAQEAVRNLAAARHGTLVHAASAPDWHGGDINAAAQRDADAITALLDKVGANIVDHDRFVACDELQAAGTFDLLLWVPRYGFIVADIKTGRQVGEIEVGIQVATYARGTYYDRTTDERTPWGDHFPNQERGILIHAPRGTGKAKMCVLDLVDGRGDAQRAASVLRRRKRKSASLLAEV